MVLEQRLLVWLEQVLSLWEVDEACHEDQKEEGEARLWVELLQSP